MSFLPQVNTKPFLFYWERDPLRSSPFPLPIDEQMKLNSLFQKTHQSIPGMWVSLILIGGVDEAAAAAEACCKLCCASSAG
jgi:hypothetical protein